MNVLITNSVPLNGGDEALLRALVESLRRAIPGVVVSVLTKNLDLCRAHLPDLDLGADLEFARSDAERDDARRRYDAADLVLSAPGGFFHDHYAIEPRLRGLELALSLGKPVALAGQSIGPFWKPPSIARVREVFDRLSAICVRDEMSRQCLESIGVSTERVVVGADLAFLWRSLDPALFRVRVTTPTAVRHVGVCVRPWPLKDDASAERTIANAVALVEHLLADPSRRVTLVSTCQGIDGYWDDSLMHRRVLERLGHALQPRVLVDRQRREPRSLIAALGSLDALVSMRLHGCLLAMLGGTPAAGLGYEDKTEQIYRQLGLSDLQVPFDAPANEWIALADRLIARIDSLHRSLPARLDRMNDAAMRTIDALLRSVSCPSS